METIYHSGRILTMIDQDDDPEAVLVRDGRIAAVGTLEQVRAAATPRAERVDLAGRTLMPSFIDSHGHILQHGMLASLVDLENARSIDEIVSAFGERLAQREPDDRSPVVGAKYDPQLLAEGRHPTREDLDAVTTDRPSSRSTAACTWRWATRSSSTAPDSPRRPPTPRADASAVSRTAPRTGTSRSTRRWRPTYRSSRPEAGV